MVETFGAFLRRLRLERGYSSRQLAMSMSMDPSNYAKFERDEVNPPTEEVLSRIAIALGIDPGTDDRWLDLKCRAEVGRGQIPAILLEENEVALLLPAFFASFHKKPESAIAAMKSVLEQAARGEDLDGESDA